MSARDVKGRVAGDLATLSLFDVCQFLMVAGKTGTVTVRTERESGTITFANGQIVAALDSELREGEEVVMEMLGWQRGTFEFAPAQIPAVALSTIRMSTGALLLEAARRMDEGEDGTERRSDMDSLLPNDTPGVYGHAVAFAKSQHLAEGFSELLKSLHDVEGEGLDFRGDVTLEAVVQVMRARGATALELREGQPPLTRSAAGLLPLGRHPASRRAIERIAGGMAIGGERVSRSSEPGGFEGSRERELEGLGLVRMETTVDDDVRGMRLTLLGTTAPAPRTFGIPDEVFLPCAHAARGLLLAASPPRSGKSTLAAAIAVEAMAARAHRVIHFEEAAAFRLRAPGSLVESRALPSRADARETIARAIWSQKADVVIIDALRTPEHLLGALDAAEEGALIIGALEARRAPEAVARCIAWLDRGGTEGDRLRLSQLIVAAVAVRARPSNPEGEAAGLPAFEHDLLPGGAALADMVFARDVRGLMKAA